MSALTMMQRLEAVTDKLETVVDGLGDVKLVPGNAAADNAKAEAIAAKMSAAVASGGGGLDDVHAALASIDLTKNLTHVNKGQVGATGAVDMGDGAAVRTNPNRVSADGHANLKKGTWFVENLNGGAKGLEVVIDKGDMKHNVYIIKCENVTVRIPTKVKSINVDSCKRTDVNFISVVSICEVLNSDRVNIYVDESAPSFSIDKSSAVNLNLSAAARKSPPEFYTSGTTALNISIPGPRDDPIELPVPERFKTTLNADGSLSHEAVSLE